MDNNTQPSEQGNSIQNLLQRPQKPSKGLAIAALVLGIVGILGSWVPLLNVFSLILGIIGLILGAVAIAKKQGGLGITGTVLSALTIIIFVGMYFTAAKVAGNLVDETISAVGSNDFREVVSEEARGDDEEQAPVVEGEGTVDGYDVKIVSAEVGSAGKRSGQALFITYEWTNTDSREHSFAFTLHDKIFQNGEELGHFILADDDLGKSQKDIQSGTTQTLRIAYETTDFASPVDVEVTPLISFSDHPDKVSKTFGIQQ